MNKDRRAAIDAVLETLQKAIDALPSADDLQSAIQAIAEEEREYFDNMHENLQGGEKGQAADEAANALEEAEAEAEELRLGDLSDKLAEIVARLESARDGSYGTEA